RTSTTSFTLRVDANDPPTLDPIGGVTLFEDSPQQTVNLAGISAGPGESQTLTVTATSDKPSLVPDPAVTYVNGSSTGTLTFAPAANQSGLAIVTVTVSDGQYAVSQAF